MVEKLIRRGICHEIHRYPKANNKYMKNYDKKKESLYLMCLDANNLYGWKMPQKWPGHGFKWTRSTSKFNKDFIKNYDENSNKGYILEVDIEYPQRLHNLHRDLPVLPERMTIKKCNKLVWNLRNKKI